MHFQKKPYSQNRIITVLKGKILDVIIDIRPKSPKFGKWTSYVLDDKSFESIFLPSGFAHGFLSLEETIISYKVDCLYNPKYKCSIIWNDNKLKIDWPIKKPYYQSLIKRSNI